MRRLVPKHSTPRRPWDSERIGLEKEVKAKYGLRRKKEIWRAEAVIRWFRGRARELEALKDKEGEKQLIESLAKMGLVGQGATIEDVLGMTTDNLFERRLQTIVFKKGIAKTIKQARQYIVHGHIAVGGRRVRWPSMIVPVGDEPEVKFYGSSEIGVKK
ncbi:MAG: 30S ribosomal protein S4 [Candidatus Aenigmatarchaeota archaeon]